MSADPGSTGRADNGGGGGGARRPEVKSGRFALIWLIPIVAAAYGAYVGIEAYRNQGPKVEIYFHTGEGLVAGKTRVKFRSVDVGAVESIRIRQESPQVVVTCSLVNSARPYLSKGAKFWVVKPRVSFGKISGLGTLVSGAYIAAEGPEPPKPPAVLEPAFQFDGLESPPIMTGQQGLSIKLHARRLGSLAAGAPIYYREIEVGLIGSHQLSKDGGAVEFDAFIRDEYQHLVHDNSHFWNAGGIDIHLGAGAIDIKTESLVSVVAGGVAFDSPPGGKPVAAGASFLLHDSFAELQRAEVTYGGLEVVLEARALGSLSEGAPVYYRGDQVGTVVSTDLSTDSRTIRVRVNIYPRFRSLVRNNSVFWNASGLSGSLNLSGLHVHTDSLTSLLRGGVAFATPDTPGRPVTNGSVFKLHSESKDEWLAWNPLIWRGPPDQRPKQAPPEEHGIAAFFHHEGKSEEEAKKDEAPNPAKADERGFFHRLFK